MPKGTRNPILAGGGVHHVAIQTLDLEASLRFYRDTLGMTVAEVIERPGRTLYWLDAGDGTLVELFSPVADPAKLPAASTFPVPHFAFATTDTRAAVALTRAAGYPVRVEPIDLVLNGRPTTVAFVTGPSGEDVEFFQVP